MTAEPTQLVPQTTALTGFYRVPIDQVQPHPENVRESLGDLTEMAASLLEVGMLQPLVVMPHDEPPYQYRLLAGHRRLEAAHIAGMLTVPVILRRGMDDVDALAVMLVENGQRKNLDPIEEAEAIQALMRRSGMTQGQVAKRIGRSQAHVSHRLLLLTLTPAEQRAVRAGDETVYNAIDKVRQRRRGPAAPANERGWHLGPLHTLADQARALCRTLKHGNGRRVGGVACGECWELQIRSDERRVARREQIRETPPRSQDVVS